MALHDSKAPRDHLVLAPKHTVFLSHSGAQKGFVEQLDLDLRRYDRYPFFDKNRGSLPIGERFPPLIFKGIRQCQVGVVVLSEEFLSSKWPMLELVEIVQTTEDKPDQLKIVPIFLSISCADLGDEKKLSDWKAKWRALAESDKRVNISDWEKALKVLKSTNGLVFNSGVGEVKFREEIVGEICKRVPPFLRWDDSHVQGRSRITQIIQKRIEETPISTIYGVQVVGLYGVGGIGKTTACKLLCNNFDEELGGRACHVEFGNGTEMDLLQNILKKLTRTTHEHLKELTIEKCRARLKNIMESGRVFLAIDNVSSSSKIIDEARRYLQVGYGNGSIVVVTARSLGELENLRIEASECLAMPELEEDEAKALFLYHVAAKNEVDEEILMNCIKRCYFCKGDDSLSYHFHPLALEVLGKQLGPSDPKEWGLQLKEVDTFNQLREPENPVFSILRRSFDALLHEDKVLFMDVAIFHSEPMLSGFWEIYPDYDLEDEAHWNIFEWLSVVHGLSIDDVKKRLNSLKKKSLLEELGDGTSTIGIHDLWWEFALMETEVGEIESRPWVYECDNWEGEDSSVSGRDEAGSSLSGEREGPSVCGEDEGSSLSGESEGSSVSGEGEGSSVSGEGEGSSESEDSSLSGEVEVVESILSGGGWEKLQRISIIGNPHFQNNVKRISFSYCSKVTVLRLANANVEDSELDLSGLKQMKILEIVCSEDFFGTAFAKVIGIEQLTNLRVLIWMQIGIETTIAVEQISSLKILQVLQLNFADHREDLQLTRHRKGLSLDLGRLRLLRVARIQFEGKFTLSGLSSKMTKLRVLDLTGCHRLRNCPDVGGIIGLEVLVLRECKKLEELPNLRRLKKLLVLNIEHCESLLAVTGLGSLVALQELRAEGCYKLHALPDMSKLTNLQILDVKNCDSLEYIPGVSKLIALQQFIASGKFLEDLPDRGMLTKLDTAEIYGPDVIKRGGESSQEGDQGSKEEDELSREGDESSQEHDEWNQEEGDLSREEDELSQEHDEWNQEDDEWNQEDEEYTPAWWNQEWKQEDVESSQDDVESSQDDVESSQEDDESSPQELKPVLNLAILESVLTLSLQRVDHELTNLSKLTRLEDLDIRDCGFKTLSGLSNLTALENLEVHDCRLKRLPDMGKLMRLESLQIWSCKSLRGWDGVGRLGSLESQTSVDLYCDWTLPQLEILEFYRSAFVELPNLSQFPRLRVLKLQNARRHRCSIPECALHCLSDHLQLEILHCIDWPIIELPDLSKFPSLKELEVIRCNNLTSLTSNRPLSALEDLRLDNCKSLKALPDVCHMPGLRDFCIAKCGVTLNVQDVEELRARCLHLQVDNSSWEFGHLQVDESSWARLRRIPDSEFISDSGLGLPAPDGTEDLVAGPSSLEGPPSISEPNCESTLHPNPLKEQDMSDIEKQFKEVHIE